MDFERRMAGVAVFTFLLAIASGLAWEEGIAGLPRESFSELCHLFAVLAVAGCLVRKGIRDQAQPPNRGRALLDQPRLADQSRYRWVRLGTGKAGSVRVRPGMVGKA